MNVAADGTETKAGTDPTEYPSYAWFDGCTTNCKRWYIYLGDAFNNDALYFVFANKDPIPDHEVVNGVTKRLTIRIEISYLRNPPSFRSLNT